MAVAFVEIIILYFACSTGSNHIREKDGIWAVLAWLSVLEHTGKGVEEILQQHWGIYGRNYFTRYDYEECALDPCNEMIAQLEKTIAEPSFIGKAFSSGGKTYKVKVADNFSYTDPVDKSVSTKQVNQIHSSFIGHWNSNRIFSGLTHCLRRWQPYCSASKWHRQFGSHRQVNYLTIRKW